MDRQAVRWAYRLQSGQLTRYAEPEGLPRHTLFGFAQDRTGRIWAATSTGAYRLDHAHWTRVDREADGIGGYLQAIVFDRDGTLWTAGANGVFYLPAGASSFLRHRVKDAPGVVLLDRAGAPWYFGIDGVTALGSDPRAVRASSLGSTHGDARIMLFSRDGAGWGISEGRIVRFRAPRGWDDPGIARSLVVERAKPEWAVSGPGASQLFEDREGDVWMATGNGIDRFRPNRLLRSDAGELTEPTPLAVGSDGALWYQTDHGGVAKIQGSTKSDLHYMEGFGADSSLFCFHRARDGALWMGGNSLLLRYQDGAFAKVALPFNDPLIALQAVTTDATGGVWISAVSKGVWSLVDGRWAKDGGLHGLSSDTALLLETDHQGRLWMGYSDDRIAIVDHGHLQSLGPADGLRVGNVLALHVNGERAWIGGSAASMMFDGHRFWPLRSADGTTLRAISGIAQTADGDLWFNGAAGLTHATASQAAAFLRTPSNAMETETFNGHDGIEGQPSLLRPLGSAASTNDGRVWVTTTNGLYSLDAAHLRRNATAPQVVIQSLIAEGARKLPTSPDLARLAAKKIEFDYTAASLANPERVQFSYRLDGLEPDWQPAGTRRQAFYTNLPPGNYTFKVRAVNEDGVASVRDAALAFTVAPAWWQTRWFVAAAAMLLLLAGWLLHRLRLRQVSTALRIRLEERERIARDLHDTLLQGTLGLVLGFHQLATELADDDPRRGRMEGTLDDADRMLEEARDRVTTLRARSRSPHALVRSLESVASGLARRGATSFSIDVQGPPHQLHGEIAEEVFLFAREALANAFHHAEAATIQLTLAFDASALETTIADNGRGIAPEILAEGRPGRWGIVGMRERAARIGGRFQATSNASNGTRITLHIPARRAYTDWKPRWKGALASLIQGAREQVLRRLSG